MKKVVSILSVPTILMSVGTPSYAESDSTVTDLAPLMVEGEKTRRTLRDTASSVVVNTGDDIDRMAAVNGSNSLLDHIPNIVTVEPGNEAPTVRGIDGTGPASGANAFFAGTRPRLNYQIDGRTLGFNESLFQDSSLWDISQVEVYRGPQSTQQGRNSIAGAIVMRTADPTFEWEGKVRGEMGSQDKRVGSVAISGPLVDDVLAFRFAADYQTHDSDVEFTPYAEVAKPNLYRNETVRGKLLFTPNDRIRSLVTFGHTDGRAPQSERVKRPFSDRQAEFPNQPSFRSRNTYGIWDTSWVASDNVTFEMNMSATDFRTDRHTVTSLGNLRIDGNEHVFQPMVRLRTSDGNVSGFISAYIFRTEQDEVIDIFGGGSYRDESESNAIFGEATWWMTDAYRVTLGGRYEEEKRYRVGNAGPLFVDFDETYKEFLPKATLAWDANDDWTLGMTVGKGYNGGGAGITFSAPFVAYTYDPEYVWNYEGFLRGTLMDGKLDVTANIFYNDFEDMQLPYSLSSSSTVIRNAEKATTYGVETGAKYHFSQGNMVFVNLGLLSTKVDSYGDVTVEGNDLARAPAFSFDVGFTITPMPRLEFSTNLRYTDAYYSDATNSPRGKVDAYSVANAQMVYTVNSTRFYLTAENIFDSDSEVSVLSGATASADSATLLKPRTISAGIEYSF